MKRTKILSLLLALTMLLSLAVVPASAAEFTDVNKNYQYYDAIQNLVSRGIINGYEDGTFKPEATITRAEFCKMVIYAIGHETLANTAVSTTGFPDVDPTHWAAGAIKAAYDMKIINGFEDGTFRANENVTYDQAIKMVVCAKYDKFAELASENGGFPKGYRSIGTKYGFLKDIVDGVYNSAAKRGTIAKLMDNMIDIDLSKYTDDPTIVEPDQEEEIKGQIIAVPGATLEGSDAAKNTVKIRTASEGVLTFSTKNMSGASKLLSMLGKRVVVLYEEKSGSDMPSITSIREQSGKNEEIVLDMDAIDFPLSGNTVEYEDEDGDTDKFTVDSDVKVMYNGSATDTELFDLLNDNRENSGSIRFLFTSGDTSDAADVVFVTIYENYQVTSVTNNTKTIRVTDGTTVSSFVLDEEERGKNITITRDGNVVDFSTITKNIIVSIAVDESGDYIQVLLGKAPFSGTVTAVVAGEGTISVGGKSYEFANEDIMNDDIVAGSYVKVYLDAFGKIAKYELQAASSNHTYAYLTGIRDVAEDAFESEIKISVINLNATTVKFSTYTLAKTVNINGLNYNTTTSFDTIEELLIEQAAEYVVDDFGAPEGTVYQPIKYSTDSNKRINSILIGKEDATDADLKVRVEENIKCTTNHTELNNIYTLSSSTFVLFVPEDDEMLADADSFLIRKGNSSGLVKNETYNVLLVDNNNSGTPKVAIVYKDMSGAEAITAGDWVKAEPVIVTGRGTDQNQDSYIRVRVPGAVEDTLVYDTDKAFYNSVQKGDIIRYIADTANKKIDALEIVVRAEDLYGDEDETVFVKVGAHNAAGTCTMVGAAGGYAKMIREGETNHTSPNASMSLMAGVVYKANTGSNGFWVAFDYDMLDDDGEEWTEAGLGGAELINKMTVDDSTKVICMNMKANGSFDSYDEISYSELGAYVIDSTTTDLANADRVFVYRSSTKAKMIFVFRAMN